ncbi:MAG: 2-amino-4-hydroxy-6-hydroxymethyldihydropteridine diphosphokinase [Flavobacteriales bacterium]|nr:2-amino-4-hydroxy-6-hydroxymethyldihydropteridine diphosphokinase [Flavobacteriales bacterium]
MAELHRVFLCIGGNLGDRLGHLEDARMFIRFNLGDIVQVSPVYETEPWKMETQDSFLNQVLEISTELSVEKLFSELEELDEFFGRERSAGKYLSRNMDVDILFYDDVVMNEDSVTLPHPRLHLRRFVLTPLNDIAPDFIHPVLKKNTAILLNECNDASLVKKF